MILKRIILVCLALAVLTGVLLMLPSNKQDIPVQEAPPPASGSSASALFSGWLSKFSSTNKIKSDGKIYPVNEISAVPVAEQLPEGDRLPVVGDKETLLKLLLDRGALYDDSGWPVDSFKWRGGEASYAVDFDIAESEFVRIGIRQNIVRARAFGVIELYNDVIAVWVVN